MNATLHEVKAIANLETGLFRDNSELKDAKVVRPSCEDGDSDILRNVAHEQYINRLTVS